MLHSDSLQRIIRHMWTTFKCKYNIQQNIDIRVSSISQIDLLKIICIWLEYLCKKNLITPKHKYECTMNVIP